MAETMQDMLTREQAAEVLKVHPNTISRYVNGYKLPDGTRVAASLKAYRVGPGRRAKLQFKRADVEALALREV